MFGRSASYLNAFLGNRDSGIQNTVVYVIMNGFNRPELSAFGAGNSRPTIANRQFVISGMTLRQKLPVFFMDIAGFAARLSDAVSHQSQGHIQGYIEEEHGVRFGQAHLVKFKIFQPVKIRLPKRRIIYFNHLIEHIARRIAVGNDDASLIIKGFPLHLIGCKAVDSKKSGRCIGIDRIGVATEVAAQVHLYQGA